MGQAGAYTACAVLARYGYGARLEAAVMALCAPINEKPPLGGLTGRVGMPYAEIAVRVIVNLQACSSPVKHPITQPLDMGQICQRRAGRLDRAAYRLPKRSGPKHRGYTGIRQASLPSAEVGGRGAIPGLPSIGV